MNNSSHSRRDFLKAAGVYASSLAFTGCRAGSRIARDKTAGEKPNILWVTCEDISPILGCYGDKVAVTPHLDKLAARWSFKYFS